MILEVSIYRGYFQTICRQHYKGEWCEYRMPNLLRNQLCSSRLPNRDTMMIGKTNRKQKCAIKTRQPTLATYHKNIRPTHHPVTSPLGTPQGSR